MNIIDREEPNLRVSFSNTWQLSFYHMLLLFLYDAGIDQHMLIVFFFLKQILRGLCQVDLMQNKYQV